MADRELDEMMRRAGSQMAMFVRSVALLAAVAIGIPSGLMRAARERFGGAAPMHGVPSPADWEFDRIRGALTNRLTDQTVADIVIRACLVVGWVAVIVLVVTVVVELVHMIRHAGLPMPDIRGLGWSQSMARYIAVGLLVVVPLVAGPSRALARDGGSLNAPARAAAAAATAKAVDVSTGPDNVWVSTTDDRAAADPTAPASAFDSHGVEHVETPAAGEYLVVAGDSIFSIAQRHAGAGGHDVAAYADRMIDLNMGRQMHDGQRLTNAAYIEPGWTLLLPGGPTTDDVATSEAEPISAERHEVVAGESLWSIADDELGDPQRWPEIFEANEGRAFDDGRQLSDPDLIQPGWDLVVPGVVGAAPSTEPTSELPPAATASPAPGTATADGDATPAGVEAETPSDDEAARPTSVVAPDSPPDGASSTATPDNVWVALADPVDVVPVAAPPVATPGTAGASSSGAVDALPVDGEVPQLLTLGRAAMLSGGVLTLLAVRRRNQLRRAQPRTRVPEPAPHVAATERSLRAIDSGERFARVDVAVRAAAKSLIEQRARVTVVVVETDGAVDLYTSGDVALDTPWVGGGTVWRLPAATPLELLAPDARSVAAPSPTLVQLGQDLAGSDVYVDLEGLEAIEIGGPGDQADAIVGALAVSLAGSVLAEVTTLIGVGVPDSAFLGHRLHVPVRDTQRAFEAAADAIGSTAGQSRSTFELRARATAGETWEPAVVLAGSAVGTVTPPSSRTGLAVVSASPIHGPSSRLAPDGDAWTLLPAGIRLVPVGVSPAEIAALAELVAVPVAVDEPGEVRHFRRVLPRPDLDDDLTLAPPVEDPLSAASSAALESEGDPDSDRDRAVELDPDGVREPTPIDWSIIVRLVGPLVVTDRHGTSVEFERSKTRELIAWLATHRSRATRTSARTALWDLDVRDSTFANVVSEARRSLARLVPPPTDDEWVGRTLTDALPLHPLVRTDADLIEAALVTARLQPPAQAIATLRPAVDLIEGMPFEGTSFLWPDAEGITSNLVLLATSAAAELAAHCLSVGDVDGVFAATGRGLRVLPGHEALIGLRMQAYARGGDHAGVRHEWESYERVITADPWSDGEPSPKLVDLRRQLLNPSR